MKHFLINAFLICVFLFSSSLRSQTPGQIFNFSTGAGSAAVLNQNNDNFISKNGVAFNNSTPDEISQFEQSDWITVFHMMTEPNSDLQTGPSCGATEIVDNQITGQHAAYFRIHDPNSNMGDGDEKLVIRMRTANEPGNAAYGYSLLLDTDLKIGSSDPNSVSGNPGFEIELLYGSGNSGGVRVLNVDGESAPNRFTTLVSYPTYERHQRSYALNSNCTGSKDDPVFMDFYVDFSDMGITVNTTLRMAFATSSSSSSALGGSASDIGGADDGQFPNDDAVFEAVVLAGPTTSFNNLQPSTLFTTESPDSLTVCAGQSLEIATTTSHYAMDFDGSNDVISFTGSAHNTAFSNNTQTVELWFKTTDATGPMLGYSGTNYSSSQSLFVPVLGLVNGKLRGEFWTGSNTNAFTSSANYNDGNFHHVALTSIGTSYSMYVDGVLLGSFTGTVNNSWANFMTIGAAFSSTDRGFSAGWNFFDGEIAEVRVWNTARTVAQISANYNKTIYTLEDGLEVNLTFPEGTGTFTVNNVNGVAGSFSSTPAFISLTAPITNISVGPFTYLWSNAATTLSTTVTPGATTPYYVTITDQSSNTLVDTVTVVVSAPTFSFAQDTIKSCGANTVTVDAGAGWASYAWSNAATTQTTSVTTSGTYTVTVTDANGCTASDSLVVSVINGSIVQNDTTICSGQTLKLSTTDSFTNNNSMTFDGNGDFVLVPYDNSFNINTLTIESWVYTGNLNRDQGIFEKGNINTQYVLFYNIGSVLKFRTVHPSGTNTMSVSSTGIGLTPNNWHHIAATYDGANKKIYVDGVLKSTYACTGAINTSTVGSIIGAIGGGTAHGNYYWDGKLDEVRVWNVARSASEIASTYNKSVSAASNGLIGYWNFEEGSGSSTINLVDDQSASLNGNAVFNNTPSPASVASNLTYSWSTAATTSTITVSPSATTKYYVTVSDGISSCIDSVTVTVNNPTFALAQDTIKSCGASSATIDAGAGWASYAWSNAATTQTTSVTTSGTYTVTVTDANGCTASDSLVVSVINGSIVQNDTNLCFGSSVNLSITNAVSNNAADFTNGDFLRVANLNNFTNSNNITIGTWLKTAGSGVMAIASQSRSSTDANTQFRLSLINGKLNFWDHNSGVGVHSVTGSGTVNDGQWHHVAFVKNNTVGKFYIDGVLDSTVTLYTKTYGSNDFVIGKEYRDNQYRFVGQMDDFQYWQVSLTDAEVQAIYNRMPTQTSSLLLNYNFDNDNSSTIADVTSNNNDAVNNSIGFISNSSTSYLWSTASTATSINVSPTATTKYYVTTTNGISSCTDSVTVTVNNPTFTFAQDTIKSCGANTVTVDAGAGWASYAWSNAATTQTTSIATSGTYFVTVTDNNGCSASDSVVVSVINSSIVQNDTTICLGESMTIEVENSTSTQGSVSFDGVNDHIRGSDAGFPSGNSARTIEAWVKTSQTSSNGSIFEYGTVSGNQRSGLLILGGNLYYVGQSNDLSSSGAIGDNQWHHVAATFNGSSLKLYVDGNVVASKNTTFNTVLNAFTIGRRGDANSELLNGSVDEIRVWNFAKTASEINTDKDKVLTGNELGLVYYAPLNEQSGTTATSLVSTTNNGTLNNGAFFTASTPIIPFTYNWSTTATTSTITVSPTTTTNYYVTVSDGFVSCIDSVTVTVNNPTFTFAQDTIKSCGASTATIDAGAGWASYLWSNSATTQTTSVSASGTYSVTVTDNNGCTATDDVVVSVIGLKVTNPSVTTCNGDTANIGLSSLPVHRGLQLHYPMDGNAKDVSSNNLNGEITGNITGSIDRFSQSNGSLNFPNSTALRTFIVNNPSFFNGTTDFTYSFWIKPENFSRYPMWFRNGQWGSGNNFGVRNNTLLMMNGITVGSGTVSFTPTLNSWNHMVIRRKGDTISQWSNGVFQGNYTTSIGNVFSPTKPLYIGSGDATSDTYFRGDMDDFAYYNSALTPTEIIALYSAPNPSMFSYSWSNGDTTSSINVSPLTTTKYYVTISDGISSCVDSVTVTVSSLSFALAQDTITSCGASSATIDAGAGWSSYLWSNAATTQTTSVTASGTYFVTVTDNFGCTVEDSLVVTINPAIVSLITVDSTISCNGLSDGGATASATGGVSPYTFAWSNSATTASITGVSAGTYTVTVTDSNACTSSSSVTITEPTVLSATTTVNANVSCNGLSDGSATASVTGGTTPYTYVWSNAATTPSITGVSAGTYTVTVTDDNLCTSTSSVTITEPAVLSVTASTTQNVTVFGNNDGSASATVSGGTPVYNYAWSNGGTAPTITNLTSGTYTATITDANGCTSTSQTTVSEPGSIITTMRLDSNVSCNGGSDGGIGVSVTGGVKPYSILWSNSLTDSTLTGLAAGTYSVTITDANGGTAVNGTTITEPAQLVATANLLNSASCAATNDGAAQVAVTGGTLPYNFQWNTAATTAAINSLFAGTYTVTVTDGNNCTAVSTVTVLNNDTVAPVIVTQSLTVYLDASGLATITANDLDNGTADNCQLASIAIDSSNFNCSEVGANTVVFTATDASNNASTTTVTVTVIDSLKPVISTQPLTVYLDANGTARITASDLDNGTADNCQLASIAIDSSNFNCSEVGANTVVFTATDVNNNVSTANVIVTVVDSIKPIVATQPLTVYLDANGLATITANDLDNGTADNCQVSTISIDSTTFDYTELGPNNVWFKAIDVNSNVDSGIVIVTVLDTTQPILATQPRTIYLDANGQASITAADLDNGTTDNGTLFTIAIDSSNFDCSEVGANTVVFTATDASNNASIANVTVTVIDSLKPIISTQPLTVYLGTNGLATITAADLDNGTTDNCQIATIAIDSTTFDYTELGPNNVWFKAIDVNSNVDSGIVIVTVLDTTQPILATQPRTIYLDANGQASITAADLDNGTTDNGTLFTIAIDSSNFDCSEVGANTVVFTATDASNNASTANVTVTVIDSLKPVISTQPLTVYLGTNGLATITANDLDNGTADNCQLASIAIDSSNFNCSEVGANSVVFTATDASNNVSTANVIVTVVDSIKPIIATQPLTVYLDASGQASITPADLDNGTTDNCQLASIAIDSSNFDCSEVGANTVVFTATDVNSNVSTANVTVTVLDTIKPTVTTQPLTVYLDANGSASITTSDLDNGTTDNCQIATLAIDSSNFDCTEVGANTVVFTATDVNSNVSTANVTVTVLDTLNPIVATQPLTVYLDASGSATITANDLDNGTADNCQIATLAIDSSNFDCTEVGANSVVFTATDASNNVSTANVIVTVVDSIKPIVSTQSLTVYLDANGSAIITANDLDNGTADNCQLANIAIDSSNFDCSEVGANTVVFTATDVNNNVSTATVIVTVVDSIKPILATQSLTVYLDANGQVSITANDLDNGTTDNCQIAGIAIDSSNFDCSEVGANTVNFKALDASGNRDSMNVTVTVIDSIKPTITTQPLTVYLGGNGLATITTNDLDNGTSDNCQVAIISIDSTTFDVTELGPNNVRFTAVDVNGNRDSTIEVVTVLDTIAPMVSGCPTNITISTAINSCDAVVTWVAPTANDNGQLDSLISSHVNGGTFPLGITTITYVAYDQSMNTDTCSFTITVIDSVAPIIANAPSNISVSNDAGQCGAVVAWTLPTATDNCQLDSLIATNVSGTVFTIGTTTVTYIAYDAAMNTDTISFTITVNDTELPTISCIADTTICGGVFTYAVPTATDNCGIASVVRTSGLASGTVFPVGSTIVTHVVTDIHGNIDSCSFTVTRDALPTVAVAGSDYNVCVDTVMLSGNTAVIGTGVWGTTTTGVLITDAANPTTTAVLQRGSNELIWTISNGVCASSSDTITITYDSEPTIADAGADQIICEERGTVMEANTPLIGLGTWSIISGTAIPDDENDPRAFVTGLSDGENTLVWTINNGTCNVSTDTVNVKGADNPALTIVGDTTIYEEDGAQLYVTSDIPATRYQWDPVFSLDNGAIRTPYATPTENTVYTVRVTTADECFTEGSMEVTVIRGLVIPGAFTPNGDGMNDTWDIKNLEQFDSYSIIVYDGFGSEVFKSTNYSPWNGTYEGRDLTVGSYYYLIDYQLKGDKEIKAGVISILR